MKTFKKEKSKTLKRAKVVRYWDNVRLYQQKLSLPFKEMGILTKDQKNKIRKFAMSEVSKATKEYREIYNKTKDWRNNRESEQIRLNAIRRFKKHEKRFGRKTDSEIDKIVLES